MHTHARAHTNMVEIARIASHASYYNALQRWTQREAHACVHTSAVLAIFVFFCGFRRFRALG